MQRGILIGQLYINNKNLKLYTARPGTFQSFMPECNISSIQIPSQNLPFKKNAASPASKFPQNDAFVSANPGFDVVYNESLMKYAKTFLMEKAVRAGKEKSAKAQLKNLVDGTIANMNKRSGKCESHDSDSIVEAIFQDLENHQIIISGITLEYNDILIQEFFGREKPMTFQPAHRMVGPKSNTYSSYQKQNENYSKPFSPNIPQREINELPMDLPRNIRDPQRNMIEFPIEPPKNIREPPRNIIEPPKNIIEPPKNIIEPLPIEDKINYHEYTEYVLENSISNTREITSVLHLFRSCSKLLREYYIHNNQNFDEAIKRKILLKVMKFMLDTFFNPQSDLTNEQLINSYTQNGTVKLLLKD